MALTTVPIGKIAVPEQTRLLAAVAEAARTIRYGHILIKVQDGRVVQVEKTEKVRYE